ncbi:LLM class flavin-dependent oxidoreductase [Actinoplanes sp. NPDC051470]|uniref:LLM class flavin-dependent oxidoreductase n=1 Tax=Actinoplanes sp. NPDC051470 TaxID=3157224 RepID=UPI0034386C97
MKFLLLTLITHTDPAQSPEQRFREVVDNAVLGEELGFDGYAVGERHERPFISSSRPVVLSHIAARTSRIELWTGVTTLSLLDPVRAFEDYSTLDNLSGGRLTYRPICQKRLAMFRRLGLEPVFPTLEDAIDRRSILVGSPQARTPVDPRSGPAGVRRDRR